MAYRIEWSPRAVDDVAAIALYIARDSLAYAKSVGKKIVRSTDKLKQFPFAARVAPEFDNPNLREHFVYRYRVIYRIQDDTVLIVAVIHGSQLLEMELQP